MSAKGSLADMHHHFGRLRIMFDYLGEDKVIR